MNVLTHKMEEDPDFRTQMHSTQKSYATKRQIAYYSDLTTINRNLLKYAGVDQHGNKLFFVFGMFQSNTPLQKILLYMIDWFDSKLPEKQVNSISRNGGFVIVYFNSNNDSYSAYMNFRGIYRTLPLKYFLGLRKFIIVHPSFAIKAVDWFVSGTINKYLNDLTDYAPTLLKLKDFGIPLSKEIMDCIREDIRVIDFPKGYLPMGRKSRRIFQEKEEPQVVGMVANHIFDEMKKQKQAQKNKAKRLEDYEPSEIGVPILLKVMIMYLKMHPEFLTEEGLFRKSVSIDQQRQAFVELSTGNFNYIQSINNPHIIAALIKNLLGSLAQPLFPYALYHKFTHDQGKTNSLDYIKQLIHQLPRKNYTTLQFLLSFFVEDIIPRSPSNKMTPYNIAVVLVPCLLRPAVSSIQDLIYSKKLAFIFENIIKNFSYIFGTKEQQEAVYRQSFRDSQEKFTQALEVHS